MAARRDFAARRAALEASGIPDSKPFVADEDEPIRTSRRDWLKLTINGVPVPEAVWALIPYESTDQGAAEHSALMRKKNGGMVPGTPRVEVTRDADDKRHDAFRDGLKNAPDNMLTHQEGQRRRASHANDPLAAPTRQFVPPGMRPCWLSDKRTAKDGRMRGELEWVPLIVDGKEVKRGGMTLCVLPADVVEQSDRDAAEMDRDQRGSNSNATAELSQRMGVNLNDVQRKVGSDFMGREQESEEMVVGEFGVEFSR